MSAARASILKADRPCHQCWVPIDTTYDLDSIRDAHRRMEEGTASGKLVVVV